MVNYPIIKIFGERNTGTNYLLQLCMKNLDIELLPSSSPGWIRQLQKILPGNEWLIDLYFSYTFPQNFGWKHGIPRFNDFNELDHIYFVTVTKNPYSWLLSLYNRPYHQYYTTKPSFNEFLVSPWETVRRENTEKLVENPIFLWNQKNRSYIELKNRVQAINLRYEDILRDPKKIINEIKKTFNLKSKNDFKNIESSTKDYEKNFTYYQNYYLNREWKKELSKKSIKIINKFLDYNLMKHFSYEIEE